MSSPGHHCFGHTPEWSSSLLPVKPLGPGHGWVHLVGQHLKERGLSEAKVWHMYPVFLNVYLRVMSKMVQERAYGVQGTTCTNFAGLYLPRRGRVRSPRRVL